jgi:RNA polymerase sigma-70 factor (ECF subfamily)
MNPDQDSELLARHRAGDASAFNEIVRRHQAPLASLLRRYLRNDEDIRDVVQRCFLKAFERLELFRGEAPFRTWLFRIGVNLALNHARDQKVDFVPLEDDAAFTSGLGTRKLVAAELWRQIESRLMELPPKQRLVLELRVFHDLSFEEVAVLAGCSEESARANFHYAVKHLRDVLPVAGA